MKSTKKTNTKAAKKKANASQHKGPLRQKRRSRSRDNRGVPSVIEVTTRENIENLKPLTNEEEEDKSTKLVESKFTVGTRMAKYFYDGEQGRDRPYGGKVTAFNAEKRLYSILYDDNDVEEMSEEELSKLVVTTQQDSSSLPLSYTEQQYLTASINNMHEDLLPGMLDILREVGKAPHDDESELHLELDELSVRTQRALQKYVALNTKPRRVSYDAEEQDAVSRSEYNDLLVMIQSVQNDIVEMTRMLQSDEFTRTV